jgi:RNA polymerase sigma-54 factor
MRPSLSLSIKQKNAPKILMKQLIKLLPLNDTQLEEVIKKEMEQNPFLLFNKNESANDITNFDLNDEQINTPSIYKILIPQIDATFTNKKELKIAYEMLELVDEDGFLREQIPNMSNTKYDILQKLQKLHPAGVFSRNLVEFYNAYLLGTNQLNEKWKIFLNSLHDVAQGNTDDLINKLGNKETFDMMMQDLKLLPTEPDIPKALAQHITPDLIVEKISDDFKVSLNSNIHKILNIDDGYVNNLRKENILSNDKKFITEKFSSAKWLKKALLMRAQNLVNITVTIISKQKEFMNGGHLNPLTLSDIAKDTNVHISTVSRIVNNKYFLYNGKTTELKKMFSPYANGGFSQQQIINRIVDIINNEKQTKIILSDEQIVKKLEQENIKISRRTVAKYRQICKIESSRKRREKNTSIQNN